ncbi:uncharacterized protein LOC144100519 [Amblyomma americanum]
MIWIRTVGAICGFFVAWYAVEKAMPGTLPRISLCSQGLNVSTVPSANRSIQVVNASSEQGDTAHRSSAQAPELEGNGHRHVSSNASHSTLARRLWSHSKSLYECVCRAVDFLTIRRLPEINSTALEPITRFWELGYVRTGLAVMASVVLTTVAVKWYCGGAGKTKFLSMVETQRKSRPLPSRPVDRSSLSISSLSTSEPYHPKNPLPLANYLPSNGQIPDPCRREEAAAVVIQRWVRGEFKRRRLDGASCRSLMASPFNAREYTDRDDGATVPTVLEDVDLSAADSRVSADHASSSEGALVPRQVVTDGARDEVVETRGAPRCRLAPTLSSAQLSASLLRFPEQVARAAKRGTSQPPLSKK